MSDTTCLNENLLLEFVDGLVSKEQGLKIEAHLSTCPDCLALLSMWARHSTTHEQNGAPVPDAAALKFDVKTMRTGFVRGDSLGRYIILDILGIGGMGTVYAAYDPQLGRKVALKLLHQHRLADEKSTSGGYSRLAQEARLMARVSHPNVVYVHEVGTSDGRTFVAMEHVEGTDLNGWRKGEPRTWQQIVDLLIEAGRGLVAAHRAGLVHRDFKPSNILIDKSWRPRVADFGLAAGTQDPEVSTSNTTQTSERRVVGTPAYMAPEQLRGHGTNAQSDQFSFAITLYEALYKQHPFAESRSSTLRQSILKGEVRRPPPGAKVPARIHQVLLRALSKRPEDRFASMKALVETLERQRQRTLLLVSAGVVAASLVAGFAFFAGRQQSLPSCEHSAAVLESAWNEGRRQSIERAFVSTGRPYAEDTAKRVAEAFDAYGKSWKRMREQSCRATYEEGNQSEHLLDLRTQCLDSRRDQLTSLVTLLSGTKDATLLDESIQAVQRLPPIDACADTETLLSITALPIDKEHRAEAITARKACDEVEVQKNAVQYPEALKLLESAIPRAREADFGPVLARCLYLFATVHTRTGAKPNIVVPILQEAAREAAIAGDDELLAWIWLEKLHVAAVVQGNIQKVSTLIEVADIATSRFRSPNSSLRRAWHTTAGGAFLRSGNLEQAQEHIEAAIRLRTEAEGAENIETVAVRGTLASVYRAQGRFDEALALHAEVARVFSEQLGPQHIEVYVARANMANALQEMGRYREAEVEVRKALHIVRATLGENHMRTAGPLGLLGIALAHQGKLRAGIVATKKALSLRIEAYGEKHPVIGRLRYRLGNMARLAGDFVEAERQFRIAIAVQRGSGPHGWAGNVFPRIGLAMLLRRKGKSDEALAFMNAALVYATENAHPQHPIVASVLNERGKCYVARKNTSAAKADLKAALAIRERYPVRPEELAETRFTLAQLLWSVPSEEKTSMKLAQGALSALKRADPAARTEEAKIRQWLGSKHK